MMKKLNFYFRLAERKRFYLHLNLTPNRYSHSLNVKRKKRKRRFIIRYRSMAMEKLSRNADNFCFSIVSRHYSNCFQFSSLCIIFNTFAVKATAMGMTLNGIQCCNRASKEKLSKLFSIFVFHF